MFFGGKSRVKGIKSAGLIGLEVVILNVEFRKASLRR